MIGCEYKTWYKGLFLHHIRKAVGLHVNMDNHWEIFRFPQSLYTPAGAISIDKTQQISSRFMFIFISLRDSDIRELILRNKMAFQKCHATGNPLKNFVFEETEK